MAGTRISDFYDNEGLSLGKVLFTKGAGMFDARTAEALPVKGVLVVVVDDAVGKIAVRFNVRTCWPKFDFATVRSGGRDRGAGTPWWNGSRKASRGRDVPSERLDAFASEVGADPLSLLAEDEAIRKVVRATRAAYNVRRGR